MQSAAERLSRRLKILLISTADAMSNILEDIIAYKRVEMQALEKVPVPEIVPSRKTLSMKTALVESATGIIAEFKRRSPSKGEIHAKAMPQIVVSGYEKAGASACSVLTDTPYFGGALTDLAIARCNSSIPLLRKDFIISRRQILDAYLYGADAVLLIAAALSSSQVVDLTDYAHSLGLETLFEIHNTAELDKFYDKSDMVGVNNRDLTTFHTDPDFSFQVVEMLPADTVKVAESGLSSIAEVERLRRVGYRGFLIGETFMKNSDPGQALRDFIDGK